MKYTLYIIQDACYIMIDDCISINKNTNLSREMLLARAEQNKSNTFVFKSTYGYVCTIINVTPSSHSFKISIRFSCDNVVYLSFTNSELSCQQMRTYTLLVLPSHPNNFDIQC